MNVILGVALDRTTPALTSDPSSSITPLTVLSPLNRISSTGCSKLYTVTILHQEKKLIFPTSVHVAALTCKIFLHRGCDIFTKL